MSDIDVRLDAINLILQSHEVLIGNLWDVVLKRLPREEAAVISAAVIDAAATFQLRQGDPLYDAAYLQARGAIVQSEVRRLLRVDP